MEFNQIKRAITAKLKDKSDMPEWYYRRLEKCIGCEFNSGNVDNLFFKDRIRISHNFGKDACLKCTCGVEDKCSDPVESCPENFWQAEKALPNNILDISKLHGKGEISFEETSHRYVIEYGEIQYNGDSLIKILISNKDIENLKVKSSCGCTTATPLKTDNGTEMTVQYDTKRLGYFNKNVTLSYDINGHRRQTIVNIQGTVKK